MAKDVALFSAVLTDLGKVLKQGEVSGRYRKDAYERSASIAKECHGIFDEIEGILKLSSAVRSSSFTNEAKPMDRLDRFMWPFRKAKVNVLRGNLESLKSTITVQLAILNYADRVAKADSR